MSSYVESSTGLPILPTPYIFENAEIAFMVLEAGSVQVQALCDKYLNAVQTQFTYKPHHVGITGGQEIFLAFLQSNFFSGTTSIGQFREHEVSFWIPVEKINRTTGETIEIRFFLPYLFLDDIYAILIGREVYGFFKAQASISPDEVDIANPELTVTTLAIKQFSSTAIAQQEQLLQIEKIQSKAQSKDSLFLKICKTVEELKSSSEKLKSQSKNFLCVPKMIEFFIPFLGGLPIVFLKQFRDIADSTNACYQSVVEASMTQTTFPVVSTYADTYQLLINQLDSHPLVEQMGLIVQNGDNQQIAAIKCGLALKTNFQLGEGSEV